MDNRTSKQKLDDMFRAEPDGFKNTEIWRSQNPLNVTFFAHWWSVANETAPLIDEKNSFYDEWSASLGFVYSFGMRDKTDYVPNSLARTVNDTLTECYFMVHA